MTQPQPLSQQNRSSGLSTAVTLALTLTLCSLELSSAWASGFVVARFGGEHGHPTTSNLSAIYYNPAALTFSSGTRLMIDGTLAHRSVDYTRPEDAISYLGSGTPSDLALANSGTATLRNLAGAPFIAFASNLGTRKLTLALGFYAPFGGGASWDKNSELSEEQTRRYPGVTDGQQRWWSIDSSLKSLYLTLAAAYKVNKRLRLGLSVNYVMTSIDTIRARTVPAPETDNIVGPNGELHEGRSYLNASSSDISLGFGVAYQATPKLRLGYSYQSQPGFGEMRLEGDLNITDHIETRSAEPSTLSMSLPDIHRFGMQYGEPRQWQVRLFADYVRWSVFDRQCLMGGLDAECSEDATLNIQKNWQDAFGVRLGGSYWLSDTVEAYLGAGYDGNAAPDLGVDPSLFDMDKMSAAIGARISLLNRAMRLGVTFTQVFYSAREIKVVTHSNGVAFNGYTTKNESGPSAAGTYEQSVSVGNLYVEYTF